MKYRHCLAIAGALLSPLLALFIAAPSAAQQPIVIKFSHVVAPDTPKGQATEYFKKLAEERTKGRVKVEIFPNSQLYKDAEELSAVQLGSVQMLAPTLSKFGPLGIKEFEVFDFPYLFDSYADVHKITEGKVGQTLLKKLESKEIVGLAYWDNGFKPMSANKPLRKPDDVKGLKMRIQSSKVLEAQMRAVGALPQVMALSEVYQALQTGVVDGTENVASNFYTQKLFEVQKFLTRTDHGYIGYVVIVNKKFWDGLPPDIRTVLEGAIKEATKYGNEMAKKDNDEALAAIRKSGRTQVIDLTPEEKRAWKKALAKVHVEMENRVGKQLIADIYRETGFDPSKP
ncbi:MAG: TRAP transporter substrate-binding protein [Betaproteobacteria bacterium]